MPLLVLTLTLTPHQVPLLVPLSLYSRHAAVPSNLTPILTLTLALTLTLTFTLTLTLTQTLTLTLTRHAAVPEAQRLGLEVLVTGCAFLGPPLTPIGQPTEALVVLTVLLVSELLGYSFELQRRLAHADGLQTRRKLMNAEAHASQVRPCCSVGLGLGLGVGNPIPRPTPLPTPNPIPNASQMEQEAVRLRAELTSMTSVSHTIQC